MSPPALEELFPDILTQGEELPSLPAVAVEILRLSRDENAGLDDYARALSSDPALAARLLKLANSSLFCLGYEVATLERATLTLGMRTVQLMALSFSLVEALPRSGGAASFSYRDYWRRSLSTAVAARELGQLTNSNLADEAFLCGLLSSLGQPVLARGLPDAYEAVLQQAKDWPPHALEREVLGYDHCRVGGALLEAWGMPDAIYAPVGCWGNPSQLQDGAGRTTRTLTTLVHLAALTTQVLCGEAKGEALGALHASAEGSQLSREQVDTLLLTLENHIRETADLLEIEVPREPSHYEILEEARRQMTRLSLDAATTLRGAERRTQLLASENRKLAIAQSADELTTLGNRAYFDRMLAQELRARLQGTVPDALGLLIIDVDGFAEFEDEHGEAAGREALRTIGQAIKGLTRDTDAPARYADARYAVIVPSTTATGLGLFAERLRRAIGGLKLPHGKKTYSRTLSVGGACLATVESLEDATRLISAAEACLARAGQEADRHEICADAAARCAPAAPA